MLIYIILYVIALIQQLYGIEHEKPESVSLSVRITTWFSVVEQLSSVELASDKIFLLEGRKNVIKVIV